MQKKFELASVFTDNMVLQRDCKVPIWGKACDECAIKIEFCGQVVEVKAINGKWKAVLSPLVAGGPYEMKITHDTNVMSLKNILVGDVWLAGGQSNMELVLKNSLNGDSEIAASKNELMRFFNVPKIDFEDENAPDDNQCTPLWQECTPENVHDCSAVAYYFAKKLTKDIKIPVGIINCYRGGTSASCWLSEEYLAGDEELRVYLDEYHEATKGLTIEEFDLQQKKYDDELAAFNKRVEDYMAKNPKATQPMIDENAGLYPWPPPMGPKAYRRPNGLYKVMLQKVVPYALKGVIWYQGEEDTQKAEIYKKLFQAVINNWRKDWGREDLPFMFVQLPNYGDTREDSWAVLREAQLETMQEVSNTGMIVTIDCGEDDNIHPVNKKPVGDRLERLVLSKVYNYDVEGTAPIYKDMKIEGNKITLYFDHAQMGLTSNGEELKGFAVWGEDKKSVLAKAEIKGDTVIAYSDEIEKPVGVSYGWANAMRVNLYSTEGLAASPFRTSK